MTVTAPPPTPSGGRRRTSRRGRPVVRLIGLVLILGGLGVLGYVGWQYWGTNVVSKQKQADIRETITDNWQNGVDGDDIGLLRVPRFGDDYEVPLVRGFDDEALASGVGVYEDAAMPGELGNFAIAGHRVTHGEPFRDFLELQAGDRVEVETRTAVFTYELRGGGSDIRLDFSVGWPLQRVPDPAMRGEPPTASVLTMLTCSELFHTRDRNVVIADLVDISDKSDPDREIELPTA